MLGKSHREIFVYFDCVQLAIGGRGHVTQHMRGSSVHHNKTKTNLEKSETGYLNQGVLVHCDICSLIYEHFNLRIERLNIEEERGEGGGLD